MTVARGREAHLGLALQIFWAHVKVAVLGDKRKHLQENLGRAAEAADNGKVEEVYRLLKPWVKPQKRPPSPPAPRIKLDSWAMGENT